MNPLNNEALALQDVLAHPTEPSEEDLSPVQCADAEIDMEAAEAAEAAPISSYTLLTEDDLRAFSPPQWIIKGVLPSHGLVVGVGPVVVLENHFLCWTCCKALHWVSRGLSDG